MDRLQRSFGRHDLRGVRAHLGGDAAASARDLGALAYTIGEDVVLADRPSLRTVAHEAAHVIQQRRGVGLADGVGRAGDAWERHANAVAERVVRGRTAEDLLGAPPAASAPSRLAVVQRLEQSSRSAAPEKERETSAGPSVADEAKLADLVVPSSEAASRGLAELLRSTWANVESYHQWLATTLKDPARVAKIISFTLKLRDELPKAVAFFESTRALGNPGLAGGTRGARAGVGRAALWAANALKGVHTAEPALEKLAIQIRTATGYLTFDLKTIGRHIFWGQSKVVVDEFIAALTASAEQIVERTIVGLLHNPGAGALRILEAEISFARSLGAVDLALRQVLTAKAAEAARTAEAARAAKAAKSLPSVGGAATEAAEEGSWLARGARKVWDQTGRRALRGASSLAAGPVGWIDEKARALLRRGVLQRASANLMEELRHLPLEAMAREVQQGADAVEVVARRVGPLARQIAEAGGRYAGPVGAGISAGITATKVREARVKADEARSRGDLRKATAMDRIAWIESAQTVANLAASVPGPGTVISLAGDVIAISTVWVIESSVEIDEADDVAARVESLSDVAIRDIPVDVKIPMMRCLALGAARERHARAFLCLYYRTPDAATAVKLRAAIEPALGSAIDHKWTPTLRNILAGIQRSI
ncbi:MAG: DUF4157 domain-containing protein [Nannocystaceae bacterium]